jgi:signal transduction histidine kinase
MVREFDPAAVTARQVEGFGLQAMRERAETLGGSLEVLSQPGLGTKVIVHAPIEKDAETRR